MKALFSYLTWTFSFVYLAQGLPLQSLGPRRNQLPSELQQKQQLLTALAQRRSGAGQVVARSRAGALLPAAKVNEKGKARDWLENYEGGMATQDSPDASFRFNGDQTGEKHQLMDFYGHQSQLHNLHSPVMHHTHTAHIYDPNFSAHLDYGGEEGFAGHGGADQVARHPEAYPGEMIEDENTLSKYIAPPVFENNNQKNQIHRHHKFSHSPEELITEKTNTKSLIDSLNSMMTPLQDQVDHPEEYGAQEDSRKDDSRSYQKSFSSRPEGGFDKYDVDADKGVFKTSIEENGGYRLKTYDDREDSSENGREHEYHHTHNEDMDSNTFHDQSDDRDRGQHDVDSHYGVMNSHRYHDQGPDRGEVGPEDRGGGHNGYGDEGPDEAHQRSNYDSKLTDDEVTGRLDADHVKQFMRNKDTDNDPRIEGSRHAADQELSDQADHVTMPEQDSASLRPDSTALRQESAESRMDSQEQGSEHPQLESHDSSDSRTADVRMERPERPRFQQDEEPSNNDDGEPSEDGDRDHGGGDAEQKPIEVVQDEHGKFQPLHNDDHTTKEAIKYLQQVHAKPEGDESGRDVPAAY